MRIQLYLLGGLLFILVPFLSAAQIKPDYKPIDCQGPLPKAFSFDLLQATQEDIKNSTVLEGDKAKLFFSNANNLKKRLFNSGSIYFNDELTGYVEAVAEKVLQHRPETLRKIDIYLTRHIQPNAYALPDGTIFFNIGLLSKLDNHAEVAFIIAHEAAHVIKKHAAKDFKRLGEVAEVDSYEDVQAATYRQLQYSRESELDADGLGMRILLQSSFNADSAIGALRNLNVVDTSAQNTAAIDYKEHLNTDFFTIDSSWVSKEEIQDLKEDFEEREDHRLLTEKIEDIHKSHPNIEKRVIAVEEIIEASMEEQKQASHQLTEFQKIKKKAMFEMVENHMRFSNYVHASYYALRLIENHPDNIFVNAALAKSLYWIGHFKEIKDGDLELNEPYTTSDENFFKLFSILVNIDISDAQKLSYSFAKERYDRFPDSPSLLFYMAVNTESYVGKNASYSYYSKYMSNYPQGQFIPFVKRKIDSE